MFAVPNLEQIHPVTGRDDRDLFPGERFAASKLWEGVVLSVGRETFHARLMDKQTGRPEIEADVYRATLTAADDLHLQAGASFDWAIGYWADDPERRTVSYLRLRKLPPLTAADLERAKGEADETRRKLGWA